ncbi:EamA family transporter [Bacillus massiliigorillae]|uniref:EamA family transporter n=1 Tax=Bacillus massiliigorillae TaxID=1243664 RepID=UPI0003A4DDF5|nr:EamA family transporter [Bacillus massiliigorillae]
MMLPYVLLFMNILLLVGGQWCWKLALEGKVISGLQDILGLLLNPMFISGIGMYGIGTIIYVLVLSKLPLSVAYPLQSIAYVLGMFLAWMVFKENITSYQWIGIVLIVCGAIFIAKGAPIQ